MDNPPVATQTNPASSSAAPTPQPTAQAQQPSQQAQASKPSKKPMGNLIPVMAAIVIVLVIAGVGYAFLKGDIIKSTTTTFTTTVVSSNVSTLSGCANITSPGKYFISYPLKTAITSGACIDVMSSDVNIVCNTNKLTGSGPFDGIPPYTYGIEIDGQNNVMINGCGVRNFSYGIFAISSSNVSITGSNLSMNYMANLYLNNTHNSTVANNYLSKSSSTQGSVYLSNGTHTVSLLNNTVEYNQYYGIDVNSTNNTFQNNIVNSTPVAFYCSAPDSFVIGSSASSNLCYNNTGCGFLECRGTNIPANISKIIVPYVLNTCGTIATPGVYSLRSGINMAQFVNVSNPAALANPCINIATSDVQLNCNGHSITNSTTAIFAQDVNNVTIENCNIKNSKSSGILLYTTSFFHLTNDNFTNDNSAIVMSNSTIDILSNVTVEHNDYGVTLNGSYSNNFDDINVNNNTYGVYLVNNSLSNSFTKGIFENNTKFDVFASAGSANSTLNLMQGTTCGTTDAAWATCSHFVAALLPYVPVNGCGTISSSGNYLLTASLTNIPNSCIKIDANNVALNCDNKTLTSVVFAPGVGISVSDGDNISINNCNVVGFSDAFNVSDSSTVSLNHVKVQGSFYGITFQRVSYANVTNSSINGTRNGSISLYNTTWSAVSHNNVTYGLSRNIAFMVNSSANNKLFNNSATQDYVGYEIAGKSHNNTIYNNTAQQSTYEDYLCGANDEGLGAENGGINYGTKKLNCFWLAAITKINPSLSCAAASQPGLFDIAQDAIYTIGSTCFSAYNVTTVNCNGHTIIATANGTFASFINAPKSEIENCNLKGFSTPIIASNSTLTIYNVSVFDISPGSSAISLKNTPSGVNLKNNNISTAYIGMNLSNIALATLANNYVSNSTAGYYLYNVSGSIIDNNTAASSDYNGIILNKSNANEFQDNNFYARDSGLQCISSSQGSVNNTDEGGNACSVNNYCFWIRTSTSKCG